MTDDSTRIDAPSSGTNWLRTLLLVAAAGLCFAWFLRELQHPQRPARSHPTLGMLAPPLVAAGWWNGNGPTADDLRGKVYVVEAWAFWCGPCLAAAPHTVELYQKYRERGVVFLGLTSEGAESESMSRQFLEQAQITWPNGYGAEETLHQFYQSDQMPIPRLWVVDHAGKIAWVGHPLELEDADLDQLLQAQQAAAKGR